MNNLDLGFAKDMMSVVGTKRRVTSSGAGIARGLLTLGSAAIAILLTGTAVAQTEANLTTGTGNFQITNDPKIYAADDHDVLDGCIAPGGPYKLLRFDFKSQNEGTADVVMAPVPPAGQSNDTYVWATSHGHHHIPNFNFYDLLDPLTRANRAPGLKQAFCLMDVEKQDPNAPAAKFNCTTQGVTKGWADVYGAGLACQYINITGIPDGTYVLAARTNASKIVPEADQYDNGKTTRLTISGNTVTVGAPTYQSSVEILPWTSAGVPLGTAVSWGNNRYDFFYRQPGTGSLYHKFQDPVTGTWGPSTAGTLVGPAIVGAPSAATYDKDRLDVFSRTTANKLSHSIWTPSGWFTETFQVSVGAPPSTIAPSKRRLMVMYVNTSGALQYQWFNGNSWSSGSFPGTYVSEAPALTSSGAETVHVFVRNASGETLWNKFTNGTWSSFVNLGGVITAPPSAASWNVNRIDLVGRGTNNSLYRNVWTGGTTWTGWFYDGADNLASGPVVMSNGPNKLDIFYYQVDGTVMYYRHWRWDNGWTYNTPSAWASGGGINNNVNLFVSSFGDPSFGLFHTINDGSVRMRPYW
jgi:hypothetical protein